MAKRSVESDFRRSGSRKDNIARETTGPSKSVLRSLRKKQSGLLRHGSLILEINSDRPQSINQ